MHLKEDFIAAAGEFVGTTMFLLLALGGAKVANFSASAAQTDGLQVSLNSQTIIYISTSFGLSLIICAFIMFRVTGGLFNPAITLSLWLVGACGWLRAIMLVIAQLLGGIAGAGLVQALTPRGGVAQTATTLQPGVSVTQGLFIEAILTGVLVFCVLMLAAEKHAATFMAPLVIGLTLFACHLFGVLWTGAGMNPARSLGPAVVTASFPSYHWIYWVGPLLGSIFASVLYGILKGLDYTTVVLGQDASTMDNSPKDPNRTRERVKAKARKYMVLVKHKNHGAGEKVGMDGMTAHELEPTNEAQREAIRMGDAVIIEMEPPTAGLERADSAGTLLSADGAVGAAAPAPAARIAVRPMPISRVSMSPNAQAMGAISAPGTVSVGISLIDNARAQLQS